MNDKSKKNMLFIAGPCVIESQNQAFNIAENLKQITAGLPVDFVFKASFDKANRTSIDSFRGPGLKEGLRILKKIKEDLGVKILSDVHCVSQVKPAAESLDIIQIPAFLSRQTDLVVEAAKTGKTVNVKKGQFMSPYDMKNVVDKLLSVGNKNILLTERGACFGYNNLVVDFRSFGIMKEFGFPVVFDATHSVQLPSGGKKESSGQREFVLPLSRAAFAFGVDGIFCEVHPNPENALSDKATSIDLNTTKCLLDQGLKIREAVCDK